MKITGYYNESGYQIESDNLNNMIIYFAGNHALDSQQDGTGTRYQLPLKTIQKYCKQTAQDIATEKHAKFIGIEYAGQPEF